MTVETWRAVRHAEHEVERMKARRMVGIATAADVEAAQAALRAARDAHAADSGGRA